MNYKKITTILLAFVISANTLCTAFATETKNTTDETTTTDISADETTDETTNVESTLPAPPDTSAEAYILIDQDTGRVLTSKNPDEKLYPASLTKLMTALVAVDYINEGELIEIGQEVNTVPWDSSIAGHKAGETILFENLLRGLLIPSGNDSATVIAVEVARRETGNEDISVDEATEVFAGLMNDKAKSLGCTNTHFVNPHGYHDDNHYTTARDMGLIAMKALQNDLIKEICSEKMFEGYGAGDKRTVDMYTQNYTWDNTNLLLGGRLALSSYIYDGTTGVKTGSTSQAGKCLVATATNDDDENLLCVILKDVDPDIWYDAQDLFDYGFDNYSNVILQDKHNMVKEVLLNRPPLGENNILDVVTKDEVSLLLNEDETKEIVANIQINDEVKTKPSKDAPQETTVAVPIERGQTLGTLTYTLDGNVLYSGDIIANNEVPKRTLKSDLSYYLKVAKKVLSSWLIIPVSVATALIVVFGIRIFNILKIKRKNRKRAKKYRFKSKY